MADEDEVDVLGDFSLENLFTKEDGRITSCYDSSVLGSQGPELLNCDYGITSQWLLDTTQPCWYAGQDNDGKACLRHQLNLTGAAADALTAYSNWGQSECWTVEEKSLLEKGLDLFGRSWVRLSQFIGTKTSHQVKRYVNSHLHLKFVPSGVSCIREPQPENNCDPGTVGFTELIDDIQIPASMEEVIAVVSTAQPTVPNVPHRQATQSLLAVKDGVKAQGQGEKGRASSKQKHSKVPLLNKVPKGSCKPPGRAVKKSNRNQPKKSPVLVPIGEIVRMGKEDSISSDEEINIEEDVDAVDGCKAGVEHKTGTQSHPGDGNIQREDELGCKAERVDRVKVESSDSDANAGSCESEGSAAAAVDLEEDVAKTVTTHQYILDTIFNMPVPTCERCIDPNVITDEERIIHSDFFGGRSVKTPKRYMKIRNHILECWRQRRPLYVKKTSVRSGLKNCGDVNCIGRIHAYLEQIGAINFGCGQARYLRPLLASASSSPLVALAREKMTKEELAARQQARIDAMRPRKRKQGVKFRLDGDGGYTITHSEDGEAIHTTVVQDNARKGKWHTKVDPLRLIHCNEYSHSKPAPFHVTLHLEALLVMDVHAHSMHSEVIGLLGGCFNAPANTLQIVQAVCCRSTSSGLHCDMCPVSQKEMAERLQAQGLSVVGWYHSHPTFLPHPSVQDLTTQANMQRWFCETSVQVVGFILTPFCPSWLSLSSQYRCLRVEEPDRCADGQGKPYNLPVTVVWDGLDVTSLLSHMASIFTLVEENQEAAVDFTEYFQQSPPLTYMQKCLESSKLHLNSCTIVVPEALHTAVLQAVRQACDTILATSIRLSQTTENTVACT